MSKENYKEALNVIESNRVNGFFAGEKSKELVELAEKTLEIKFSPMYVDFLMNFGAGNFGSEEIYGIIDDDFENSTVPDAIWYTLTERQESNLPLHLLVIYHTGGDEIFCLDFSKLDVNGEPSVVAFVPGVDLEFQTYEVIANDFGDFLLQLVTQEIKE